MGPYGLPKGFITAYRLLVVAVAGLIVLGGSVRVMNAGLACPDWPLCYGNFIPDFHVQVYFEFIHRVVAGSVSIVTLLLQGMLLTRADVPRKLKMLAGLSLLMLAGQIVLGGLTVLLQLKAGVVAGHLAMGTGFFAVLLWISLDLKATEKGRVPAFVPGWTAVVMVATYAQILLGGLMASNYAATACTEFPKCQGMWFPSFEGPVGIHIIHRLGAYALALIVMLNFYLLKDTAPFLRKQSRMMLVVVFVQIGLGIANVLFYTPPLLAILHLAIGLKLLFLAVRQAHWAADAVSEVEPSAIGLSGSRA
jgi:heme a synthase